MNSAKYDALYQMHVMEFGEDANLRYGHKIASKFMILDNIDSINAIENGVIFSFTSAFGADYLLDITIITNMEAEISLRENPAFKGVTVK